MLKSKPNIAINIPKIDEMTLLSPLPKTKPCITVDMQWELDEIQKKKWFPKRRPFNPEEWVCFGYDNSGKPYGITHK